MARITVGVSGGIGAYKAVEVVRGLQKRGHDVTVVMTRAARRFVGELTFEAITRRRVVSSQWAPGLNADIEHIALADQSDLLLVVPATANTIAKFAHGLADDFLSSLFLATTAPVLLAPAMNTHMLEHPAVAENLATLSRRGVRFVQPGEGYLACGWVGKGRLADPAEVVEAAHQLVTGAQPLAGRRVLVTAGPTFEDLDPVRFIGNRSSGKMGYAVADYTPESVADRKVAKAEGGWTVPLTRTVDILAALGALPSRASRRPVLIGFAAETHDVLDHADAKRRRKGVDLIVANDVAAAGAGFEVDTNVVTFIDDAGRDTLPLLSKAEVAGRILDRLAALLQAAEPPRS